MGNSAICFFREASDNSCAKQKRAVPALVQPAEIIGESGGSEIAVELDILALTS
jgi:hypothetical protein